MLQNAAFRAQIGVEHVSFISKKTEKFIEKNHQKGIAKSFENVTCKNFHESQTAINITRTQRKCKNISIEKTFLYATPTYILQMIAKRNGSRQHAKIGVDRAVILIF